MSSILHKKLYQTKSMETCSEYLLTQKRCDIFSDDAMKNCDIKSFMAEVGKIQKEDTVMFYFSCEEVKEEVKEEVSQLGLMHAAVFIKSKGN